MVFSYADVKARLQHGETDELEFKPEPNEDNFDDYVFRTVVGMANTTNGTLIIGVREEKTHNRTKRVVEGVNTSASDISDRLMRLVNEYVEPTGLKFVVYPITSDTGEPPLIGIDVERRSGEQYAVRSDGIASQRPTTYSFYVRLSGETRKVNFQTFMMHVRSNFVREVRDILREETERIPDYTVAVGRDEDTSKFDPDLMVEDLDQYMVAAKEGPRKYFFNEIRNRMHTFPNNPDDWNGRHTEAVKKMLMVYSKEMNDPSGQEKWIPLLRRLAERCDEPTLAIFAKSLKDQARKLYEEGRRDRDILVLVQKFGSHDKKLQTELVIDAIEIWKDEEFNTLFDTIDLQTTNEIHPEFFNELRQIIISRMHEENDEKKYDRIESVLKRIPKG